MRTAHGEIETPAFMPVATQGTVKSLGPGDLRAAGAQIVLANTYHLFLRPGHDVVRELGGLHRFMGWEGPILTDSGGFQVWSLAKLRKIGEDGVEFRSHVDGSLRFLSPEICVDDSARARRRHPPPARRVPRLSGDTGHHRALARSDAPLAQALGRGAWQGWGRGALFGIVQGGVHPDLRRRAVEEVSALGLDGHAIGGLAVGEPKDVMYATTALCASRLPADRPRYLMGVGKPADLVESVARGVDLFDCVMPTRNARNGQAFTRDGPLAISNARFIRDPAPLDAECGCEACRLFSRAYLRHLYVARELLAYRLLSLHNLTFYLGLLADLREAILNGGFEAFRARFLARYGVDAHDGETEGKQSPTAS